MYSKILLIDTCVITEKVPLIKIYFVKTSSIILVALKLAMLNPVHTGYRYPTDNQQDCKQPIQSSEPHREKTGLRGFRPGATQIGLYSHRSRLDT